MAVKAINKDLPQRKRYHLVATAFESKSHQEVYPKTLASVVAQSSVRWATLTNQSATVLASSAIDLFIPVQHHLVRTLVPTRNHSYCQQCVSNTQWLQRWINTIFPSSITCRQSPPVLIVSHAEKHYQSNPHKHSLIDNNLLDLFAIKV